MKVVLDTNVIISSFITPKGTPAKIRHAWRTKLFYVLISENILDEYIKVLDYPHVKKYHTLSLARVKTLFKRTAITVTPIHTITIIKEDPEDNKFLECAYEGNADYIVSGDVHLLRLKKYQNIPIISPAVFLSIIEENI